MIHHQRVLTQLIDSRRRLVRVVSLDQRTTSTICVETMACRLLTFEVSELGEFSNMSVRWCFRVNLSSEMCAVTGSVPMELQECMLL